MKRNIKILTLLLLSVFLTTGCNKIPQLKNKEEGVLSLKGDKIISADDLYKEIKNRYALETMITMADKYIFEKEFKDYKEKAMEDAKGFLDGMMEQYGSEDEFLAALQQYTTYSTIEAYLDYVYLSNLQNHAAQTYSKNQVTDKQVNKYYKDTVKGDIEVSHILITSDVSASAEEEEIKKADEAALKKANDIIKELEKEKKDVAKKFKELVKKHSSDEATKDKDGSLGKINNYNALPATYDELIEKAYKLKDGEFSKEAVKTELGYHVILRVKSHEKESVDKLKDTIKSILGEQMLQADPLISLESLKHYRKAYNFKVYDTELNKQYKRYMKNFEQSIKKQQQEAQQQSEAK